MGMLLMVEADFASAASLSFQKKTFDVSLRELQAQGIGTEAASNFTDPYVSLAHYLTLQGLTDIIP